MLLKAAAVVTVLVMFAPVAYFLATQDERVFDFCADVSLAFVALVFLISLVALPVMVLYLIFST